MDELLAEMITPAPSRTEVIRRRRLFSSVAILALAAVGVTSLTTAALFTDNETVTSSAITTGTVDLTTSGPPTFTLPAGGLAPGDAVFTTVTVTNSGSLAYRYAVRYQAIDTDTTPGTPTSTPDTTQTSAFLSSQLVLSAYAVGGSGVATCDSAGTSATGATPLGSATGLQTGALTPFIGDVATGQQQGDQTLAAQDAQTLCLRIALPITAGNEYQGTSTTVTLRFDAEQTVNNTP
jgi:predicted ribosomally synthesized peptide with SipW-like signal peptide